VSKKLKKVKGSNSDDSILGSAEAEAIDAKKGDDIVHAGGGNDVVDGGKGHDSLYGEAGDDSLYGDKGSGSGSGNAFDDYLDGGEGDDLLVGGAGSDTLLGQAGNDTLYGDYEPGSGSGSGGGSGKGSGSGSGKGSGSGSGSGKGSGSGNGSGGGSGSGKASGSGVEFNDYLDGGSGDDVLFGGDGNDVLIGGTGVDVINGGRGDDEIIWHAGDGQDDIDGGEGEDTFTLHTSDIIKQTVEIDTNDEGDLVVSLDGGDEGGELELRNIENFNLLIGAAGANFKLGDIPGGTSDEPIDLGGGDGGDTIDASGSNQAVNVDAGTGDDVVTGGNANDTISGGEGTDIITGGGGDDVIDAGVGNDQIIWKTGDGNDVISGGEGDDSLDVTLDDTQPSHLQISADADGNVILTSDDGTELRLDEVEEIVIKAGAAGTNITIGDLSNTDISQNTLHFVGGVGNDVFDASITDRRIVASGNDGDDTLLSGSGNDNLDGGAGNDVLDPGSGSGVDTVNGGAGDDLIRATVGDDLNTLAVDIVDGGADNDQLDATLVDNTTHGLLFRVTSNGDGSFSITSEDAFIQENLHVSNVETLRLIAGQGGLNIELGALSDSSLAANGINFEGSDDADQLNGSGTDIQIDAFGGGGNDNLIGGTQSDNLYGGDGNDSLSGDDGDDFLNGEAGNDIMDGGAGFDTAWYAGASGGVTVDLGIFVSQDTGNQGFDTLVNIENLEGSAFADTLTGNAEDNVLRGNDGDDILIGGDGNDRLEGGAGNDSLHDVRGGGLLFGDSGADHIDGSAAYSNDPSAVFVNYSSNAIDVHGDGSLVLAAKTGLDGYGDTDTYGANAQNLLGSHFDDHLTGSDLPNYLIDGAGDDQVFGLDGNDTFFSGSGADYLDGGDGFDYLYYRQVFNDANGWPAQGVTIDFVAGTATDSWGDTDTFINMEAAFGSDYDDTITGDANNNQLFGRAGDDQVNGGAGDDVIRGWTGNDTLTGGDGNDLLHGGADNDTMTGGTGADTYEFYSEAYGNNEFGHETITDFDVAEDVLDVNNLGITNIADVNAIASEAGGNTVLTIDGNNSITLNGVALSALDATNFIFADPPSGNPGTNDDDVIDGTENADVIDGLAGNDTISGLGGNDTLLGSEGNDTLFGGDGADNLFGGLDGDVLFGGSGVDLLDGGDGIDSANYSQDPASVTVNLVLGTATDGYGDADTLVGIENITGTIYSDTLTGDDNNNFISADNGNAGSGNDVIVAGGGMDYIWTGRGVDTVDGGAGLDFISFSAEDMPNFGPGLEIVMANDGTMVSTNRHNGEVENSISGIEGVLGSRGQDNFTGNDQDNFFNPFFGAAFADGGAGTDTLFFGIFNGVHVDLEQGIAFRPTQPFFGTTPFANFENVIGNANDDTLIGDAGDNLLEGVDGNDTLRGGDGADTLHGGSVTVLPLTLFMGSDDPDFDGFDIADYGADPASVTVNLAAGTATDGWGNTDTLISIDGVIGSAFADSLAGDGRDNRFEGLGGNDTIAGGAGADGIVLSSDGNGGAAFGLDVVADFDTAEDYIDLQQFPDIQSTNELTITQDGADTLITFDAGNILRLQNTNVGDFDDSNFAFAVPQNLVGTENNDNLIGGAGHDTIAGLGGNDHIEGREGDDVIDAGAGNDNVFGGSGDDTIFGGLDTDWENIDGGPGDDVIDIGQGGGDIQGGSGNDTITGTNGWYDRIRGGEGNDVLIDPDGSGDLEGGPGEDSIDGRAFYLNDNTGAGVLANLHTTLSFNVYGDGTEIVLPRTALDPYGDTDSLEAGVVEFDGTNFNDHILGSDEDLHEGFRLYGGDDIWLGGAGNEYVNPGSGNDYIDGGDDWTHISFWDNGNDSGGPHVQGLVLNTSSSDFAYNWGGLSGTALANTAIDPWGDTDTIIGVDGIDGTDLNDVIIGHDEHNWIQGHDGNDQIYGGDVHGDNLIGGAGNDLLDGQGGDWDTAWYHNIGASYGITVDLSTGTTSDDGTGGIDTLVSIEQVEGSEFDDLITGDSGRNRLSGNEGDDVLHGGAGDDELYSGDGNDQAFGEDGDDWLGYSPGDDLLDGGAGQDLLEYGPWMGITNGITVNLNDSVSAGGYNNVAVVVHDGSTEQDYVRDIERIGGTDHDDNLTGNSLDNHLWGRAGNDTISGGDGNDHINGEDDDDTIDGGAGDDHIQGGENDDSLTGGSGADNFSFSREHHGEFGVEMVGFGADIVHDFSIAEGDHLDVHRVPEFTSVQAMLSYAISLPTDPDLVLEFYSTDNVAGTPELNRLTLMGISPDDLDNMSIGFASFQGTSGDDVLDGTSDSEFIEGLEGNDTINGNGGNDTLHGNEGNDTLNGGADHDNLDGGPGDDTLNGGGLWDNLVGGPGTDVLDGGDDYDWAIYRWSGENQPLVVDLTLGSNQVSNDGFGYTDTLINIEAIEGTEFGDTITGDANNNEFRGHEGDDIFSGGDGHDNLHGNDGNDSLFGDDGHDHLRGDAGNDSLNGGTGDDNLMGGDGVDTYDGGPGNDQVDFRWSGETQGAIVDLSLVSGQVINDGFGYTETLANIEHVSGTEHNDTISGDANNNSLSGREGDDMLIGGDGHDNLHGNDGNDSLFGNDGDDWLVGGAGVDSLDGGSGYDHLSFETGGENQPVVIDLTLGANQAINDGFGNTETLLNLESFSGSNQNDTLTGDASNNGIFGAGGDDLINGGDGEDNLGGDHGNDTINGGAGGDNLSGGEGVDSLDGGAGEDQADFRWNGENQAVVIDLSLGSGQVINDGFGNTETLASIENVRGSEHGDTITGDINHNSLHGDDGDDTINGGAGDDYISGGRGNDVIDGGADWDVIAFETWQGVTSGVVVNLAIGSVSNDGAGGSDLISNIEQVRGSDYDDHITGDSLDNSLNGNFGNDTIFTGGGDNNAYGDEGDDHLHAEGHNNYLEGGSGNDTFYLIDGTNVAIGDFVSGGGTEDVIDLSAVTALGDFTSVQAAASDDGGGNVNIDLGGGNNLHLVGVSSASLHSDDFAF
jgi:Ca2+-binding RTX toxin-like protein